MSRFLFLCSLFLCLIAHSMHGQGRHMYVTGNLRTSVGSMVPSSDGGFWFIGNRYQNSGGNPRILLSRFDRNGELKLWRRLAGNTARDLLELPNGDLIIAGTTGYPRTQACLIRTDSLGQPLWTRVLPIDDEMWADDLVGVEMNSEGDLVVYGTVDGHLVLAGLSPTGEQRWLRTIRFNGVAGALSLHRIEEGDFYLFGSLVDTSAVPSRGEMLAIRCTDAGDLVWARSYGSLAGLFATDAAVLEGELLGMTANEGNATITIVDGSGRVVYSTYLGSTLFQPSIASTGNGGYAVAGSYLSNTAVAWFDSEYEMVRSYSYGDTQQIEQLPQVLPVDGGFVGTASSFTNGGFTPYFFFTDEQGETGCPTYQKTVSVTQAPFTPEVRDLDEELIAGTGNGFVEWNAIAENESVQRMMLCETSSVDRTDAAISGDVATLIVDAGNAWELSIEPGNIPDRIEVYDVTGQLRGMIGREDLANVSEKKVAFSLSDIEPGVYVLVVDGIERRATYRVLVR